MATQFDIIVQHDERLTKLEDGVSDLKADIAGLSASVDALVGKVGEFVDQVQALKLPERVTAIEVRQKTAAKGAKALWSIFVVAFGAVLTFLGLK